MLFRSICQLLSQVNIGVRLVENGRDVRRDFDSMEQITVLGGKNVYVDRVEWVNIPDPQTAANALMTGEIDILEAVNLGVPCATCAGGRPLRSMGTGASPLKASAAIDNSNAMEPERVIAAFMIVSVV